MAERLQGSGLQNRWEGVQNLLRGFESYHPCQYILYCMKGSLMSRFKYPQFEQIIRVIEQMEERNENIWVAVGILEVMYDDDCGWIDEYFNLIPENRSIQRLWYKHWFHIEGIEGDDLNKNFDE